MTGHTKMDTSDNDAFVPGTSFQEDINHSKNQDAAVATLNVTSEEINWTHRNSLNSGNKSEDRKRSETWCGVMPIRKTPFSGSSASLNSETKHSLPASTLTSGGKLVLSVESKRHSVPASFSVGLSSNAVVTQIDCNMPNVIVNGNLPYKTEEGFTDVNLSRSNSNVLPETAPDEIQAVLNKPKRHTMGYIIDW